MNPGLQYSASSLVLAMNPGLQYPVVNFQCKSHKSESFATEGEVSMDYFGVLALGYQE